MTDRFATLLDTPTLLADAEVSTHPIAKIGKYSDRRYGDFAITKDMVASWQRNMATLQNGRIPIDYDHAADTSGGSTKAAGWITNLDINGDKVDATIEWTPEGAQSVRDRYWQYVSPSFTRHMRGEDGKDVGDGLPGVALTNRPFLRKDMPAINLSAGFDPEFAEPVEDDYALRDFTSKARDKAASEGAALPDGSFPIYTQKDLDNAVGLAGKAKDPARAKAHIRKRAKALGLKLPDSWSGATTQMSVHITGNAAALSNAITNGVIQSGTTWTGGPLRILDADDTGGPDIEPDADDVQCPTCTGTGKVKVKRKHRTLGDSRTEMENLTKFAEVLKLDEDADEDKILAAVTDLVEDHEDEKTLEDRAKDEGKTLVSADELSQLRQDASEGKAAADELKVQKFTLAFDKALTEGRMDAQDETRESYRKLYDAAPAETLSLLAAAPKIVNTQPQGKGADASTDTGPVIDETGEVNHEAADQKAQLRMAEKDETYDVALSAVIAEARA